MRYLTAIPQAPNQPYGKNDQDHSRMLPPIYQARAGVLRPTLSEKFPPKPSSGVCLLPSISYQQQGPYPPWPSRIMGPIREPFIMKPM